MDLNRVVEDILARAKRTMKVKSVNHEPYIRAHGQVQL